MVLIPLGLVSKTKRFPIATVIICTAMVFLSIIHFKLINNSRSLYWDGPARHAFAEESQNYLFQTCQQSEIGFNVDSYCNQFKELPLKVYLQPHKFDKLGLKFHNYENLTYQISKELDSKNLQKNNPRLYQLYQEADTELKSYVKKQDLLSKENITWTAALKSIFIHSSYIHLLGNLVLLLFLAFPVEERLGPILFSTVFIACGMVGSVGFAYLSPETFYTVGASSAISGVAGAMMVLFWKNSARLYFTIALLYSKRFVVPVFVYAPIFVFASDVVDMLDPLSTTAYFAHFIGMGAGLFLGSIFAFTNSLPHDYSYPYEKQFQKRSEKSLSQYDRMKVLAEWLYYTPMNMRAFSTFVTEVNRSSMNPKVTKLLVKFRNHAFPDIFELNRHRLVFLKMLPISWLHWVKSEGNVSYYKRQVKKLEDKRDFQTAFKLCVLILSEVGWSNKDWGLKMFQNYKKASVNKQFLLHFEKLMENHKPLSKVLREKYHVDLAS